MSSPTHQKGIYHTLTGILLLLLAVGVNVLTVPWLREAGFYPSMNSFYGHTNDLDIYLPLAFDLWAIVTAVLLLRRKKGIGALLRHSWGYNLFTFAAGMVILLGFNGISPGRFHAIRIPFILLLLALLTQALNLAVVKPEKPMRNGYKNGALVAYTLIFLFLVLEVVFLFKVDSHRYNGSLASRSWFYRHYDFNEEGYRDDPYDWKADKSKFKWMVLGDSFVAGHGIDDPKDRFSDVFESQLGPGQAVYNLGLGGSDVKDAMLRLRDFPEQPDALVFSYYPNDMEGDCKDGGRPIQRVKHMEEVPAPLRYLIKRSYMLNYFYWKFPHGSDLFNYRDYLEGCYGDEAILASHLHYLDEMGEYADSLGIPMVTLVWPFMEAIETTRFTSDPVINHQLEQGRKVLDIGGMFLGRDPSELVVNLNDAHANEEVHREVGDSLYQYVVGKAWLKP